MAALNFPLNPNTGTIYTANGKTWVYNGTSWASGSAASTNAATPTSIGTVYADTQANGNTSVGYSAGNTATTGINNLALGYRAAHDAVGSEVIAIGNQAVSSIENGIIDQFGTLYGGGAGSYVDGTYTVSLSVVSGPSIPFSPTAQVIVQDNTVTSVQLLTNTVGVNGGTVFSSSEVPSPYSTSTIANVLLGSAGLTSGIPGLFNVDDDEEIQPLDLPFSVTFNGDTYTRIYVSTNSYIVFKNEAGYTYVTYNPSASNPPVPKLFVNGFDAQIHDFYYGTEGTAPNRTYRIRWEGYNYNSNFATTPLVWEVTFYENSPEVINIQIGDNQTTGGSISGAYTSTEALVNFVTTPNTGVQVGPSLSSPFTINVDSYVENFDQIGTLGTITSGTGYTSGTYQNVALMPIAGLIPVKYPLSTITVFDDMVTDVQITENTYGVTTSTTFTVADTTIGTGSGFSVVVDSINTYTRNNDKSIAIGSNSLIDSKNSKNIAIGCNAACSVAFGSNNTIIGNLSGTAFLSNTVLIGAGTCERLKIDSSGLCVNGLAVGTRLDNRYSFIATDTVPKLDSGCRNIFIGDLIGDVNSGCLNIAVGCQLLRNNTTGFQNIAIGFSSLNKNTTGSVNIAFGVQSLYGNTSGYGNIAFGTFTLFCNTAGRQNIALGERALNRNLDGSFNIAVGNQALKCSLSGYDNIAIGGGALKNNAYGSCNVAIGGGTLYGWPFGYGTGKCASYNVAIGPGSQFYNAIGCYNVSMGYGSLRQSCGHSNTAIGVYALYSNHTGRNNTAIGYGVLRSNTTGIDNIGIGCNVLVNNTSGSLNIAIGVCSLSTQTVGIHNTAIGYYSLAANDGGHFNTAIGEFALYNNITGCNNVAIGSRSLNKNVTGSCNIAVGTSAMYGACAGIDNIALGTCTLCANVTGNNNIAIGVNTLRFNTSGSNNTAIGNCSLYNNGSGNNNIAIGLSSLPISGGSDNIGLGTCSLRCNRTGNYNIAIGSRSLNCNLSGINNVGVGQCALSLNTTGDNNVAIGFAAGCSNTSGFNNIMIGCNAQSPLSTSTNTVTIGDANIACSRIAVAWTCYSDCRDKTNICSIPVGLEFVRALRPVKFEWDLRDAPNDGKKGKTQAGFLAQEVDEVLQQFDAEWMGVVSKDDPYRYGMIQDRLLPAMVKAIQELAARVEELESKTN